MLNAAERISHSAPSIVVRAAESKESVRRREVGRLVRGLTRVRATGLFVAIVSMWTMYLFDVPGLSLVGVSILTGVFLPIAIFDGVRLWRGRAYVLASVVIDLMFGVVIQTAVIALTGGIESPFLPILTVVAIVGSAVIENGRARLVLIAVIWAVIWFFASSTLLHWWPRTVPAFLAFEPGFAHLPRVVVAYAVGMTIVTGVCWQLGGIVARTVDRILSQVIDARQAAFNTLADRNRELVELSGAIAHELKNPLASVQGLVQLLERGGKNSERRFAVLKRELDRTRTVLDEFLNFSRPMGDLTVAAVDTTTLIEEITVVHEGMAAEHDVEIVAAEASLRVKADGRKLSQALTNLLMNAIDASPPKGTVQWVVSQTDDTISIGVQDEGPGMSDAIMNRATDIGATTKPHGSGIGLAVARTIAEQHGGRLALENVAPTGLRASVVLPVTDLLP